MLDEVDKMGADVRGDPPPRCSRCSIRAELDFVDHYLEVRSICRA